MGPVIYLKKAWLQELPRLTIRLDTLKTYEETATSSWAKHTMVLFGPTITLINLYSLQGHWLTYTNINIISIVHICLYTVSSYLIIFFRISGGTVFGTFHTGQWKNHRLSRCLLSKNADIPASHFRGENKSHWPSALKTHSQDPGAELFEPTWEGFFSKSSHIMQPTWNLNILRMRD